MKLKQNHPFHLVDKSPWPILASFSLFSFVMGLIKWFHFYEANLLMLSMLANLIIMYQWWRDIVRESTYQEHHTSKVVLGCLSKATHSLSKMCSLGQCWFLPFSKFKLCNTIIYFMMPFYFLQ